MIQSYQSYHVVYIYPKFFWQKKAEGLSVDKGGKQGFIRKRKRIRRRKDWAIRNGIYSDPVIQIKLRNTSLSTQVDTLLSGGHTSQST